MRFGGPFEQGLYLIFFLVLVTGIAGGGSAKQVGRLGVRAIVWFELATTFALVIGLVAVNVLRPGEGLSIEAAPAGHGVDVPRERLSWELFVAHLLPDNLARAVLQGDVLQIVAFSIFFAIALGMLGAGLCYFAARWHSYGLLGACLCLAINWLGDSLDGTLARFRNRQRPRYGFYVDHVVDALCVLFLFAGLGLSLLSVWKKLRGLYAGIAFLAACASSLYASFAIVFTIPPAAKTNLRIPVPQFLGLARLRGFARLAGHAEHLLQTAAGGNRRVGDERVAARAELVLDPPAGDRQERRRAARIRRRWRARTILHLTASLSSRTYASVRAVIDVREHRPRPVEDEVGGRTRHDRPAHFIGRWPQDGGPERQRERGDERHEDRGDHPPRAPGAAARSGQGLPTARVRI